MSRNDQVNRDPRSFRADSAPRFWSAETSFFVLVWLLLMVGGRSRFFRDPGTLWHPVVGQQILESGHFPTTDSFSFTRQGAPWIARQWLGDCTLELAHRAAGLDGLLLLSATVLACFYAWIGHRLLRAGFHWLLALLLMLLAMLASSYHFHPRPHLATIVLLGWTFARLCDYDAGRISIPGLLWLIPAFVVWTNIHDGVVGGMATVALAVIGWSLWRWIGLGGPVASGRTIAALALLTIACMLTAVINPYGMDLPRTWLALLRSPALPQIIIEHAPLLTRPAGATVLAFAAVYLFVLLGVRPLRWRATWLLPLAWFVLACSRIRHGPLFATTAVIAIGEIFPHTRWAAWMARRDSDLFRLPVNKAARSSSIWKAALIPATLVAISAALKIGSVPVPVSGSGWAKLDRAEWPVDLLPELKRFEARNSRRTPIFNEMLFGGFLIHYTPGLLVFIDDRCELYGDAQLLEYVNAQTNSGQIENWQQEYGFRTALMITGSAFDRYLSKADGWTLVRATPAATLYERRQSALSPIASGALP